MLRSKTFLRKTRHGSVVKIVREHYLREDISCGYSKCELCESSVIEKSSWNLQEVPTRKSHTTSSFDKLHFLIPDTNVFLNQIDVLEDEAFSNVIVLQTVLGEVKHRSASVYKRLRDCIDDPEKHFYTFVNEFHKDTYVEREPKETSNDYNDRAIRTAAQWYQKHLEICCDQPKSSQVHIVLLTNDRDNMHKALDMGLQACTIYDYVKSLSDNKNLMDKLASEASAKSFSNDKPVYPEHLPLSAIQRGVKTGAYLQGSFIASRENYLEGYVTVPDREERIFIQGRDNLNRSVQGDVVAIQMLPKDQWTAPSSFLMIDDEEKTGEDNTEDEVLKKEKKKEEEILPTAKVVGIIKRNWRQYCGILQKSLKNSNYHLFIPSERSIPKIRIETRQAETLQQQRIVVVIDSWPRHSRYPLGHFVRRLGEIGDKDTENEVLLLEHDVPHNNFSAAVLKCLPTLPWIITEQDLKNRVDLRDVPICSVDPPGCTDIDDALHAREMDNGNYEVGVHIADVTHFIRPGTAIDKEAANRSTTVYLIDKRIDMVPELLSSNLCSLRGNEERFAFSCVWEITPDAEIVNTKYHKSIIKSKAALTYAEAQIRIDDKTQQDDVTLGLRRLNMLAKKLKRKRIENGALTLASTEIRFHIDSETHDPIDVQAKELRETNSMVEEFMLLANISVAGKIYEDFPDHAILRRHPIPPVTNFDPIIKIATAKGFEMDVSTGKALAKSLEKAVDPENPFFNTMLRILTTRCMMQALYFCSGFQAREEFFHYGLAADIYTHFTSPIRRYADVLVHRLLAVAINADASYPDLLDKRKLQNYSNNMNYRHRMAQYAGRASVGLHTQLFFKKRVTDEDGYVLFVRKNALQVLIPKYGLEGTVYIADSKGKSQFTFNEEESTVTCGGVVLHVFDPVTVQISIDASNIQHQKLKLQLVQPYIEGFSVKPQTERPAEDAPVKKKAKT